MNKDEQDYTATTPKEYHINNVSARASYIYVVLLFLLPLGYVLIIAALSLNGILLAGVPLIWLWLYYLQKNRLTQKIVVTFPGETMNIRYISQPSFDKQVDKTITAADVVSHKITNYKGKQMVLHLRDGSNFSMMSGSLGIPDDFDSITQKILAMIGANHG